jgi:hypothetical protein
MAVTLTPNILLSKPNEAELATNWATNTQLANANNVIIVDQMDVNLIVTTPAFVCSTTNPNLGVGTAQLEYSNIGNFIFGSFVLVATDPGVAIGSGNSYGISLPFLADTVFHTIGTTLGDAPGVPSCVGEGYFEDASLVTGSGTFALDIVHVGGVAYLRPITEAYGGKTLRWIGPSAPAAIATGDKISGSFFYKAA